MRDSPDKGMKIINSDDVDFKTNATISQEIRMEDGKELVT
jgi:hypothetical protein